MTLSKPDTEKIKIKQAVIVEGKYDKIKLEGLIDGVILTTNGFRIFKDKDMQRLVQSLAKTCGIVILTDSDAADSGAAIDSTGAVSSGCATASTDSAPLVVGSTAAGCSSATASTASGSAGSSATAASGSAAGATTDVTASAAGSPPETEAESKGTGETSSGIRNPHPRAA